MKISKFLKILKDILRFFEKFLKILTKFSQKFSEKFRKFWKYAFLGGSGGAEPPDASEIIKKIRRKINWNRQFLIIFMIYERIFYLKG